MVYVVEPEGGSTVGIRTSSDSYRRDVGFERHHSVLEVCKVLDAFRLGFCVFQVVMV